MGEDLEHEYEDIVLDIIDEDEDDLKNGNQFD